MQKLIENIRTKFCRVNSCFLRKLNLKIFEHGLSCSFDFTRRLPVSDYRNLRI